MSAKNAIDQDGHLKSMCAFAFVFVFFGSRCTATKNGEESDLQDYRTFLNTWYDFTRTLLYFIRRIFCPNSDVVMEIFSCVRPGGVLVGSMDRGSSQQLQMWFSEHVFVPKLAA